MIGSKKDKVASTGLKSAKTESNSSSGLRELYIEKAKVCMGKRDCKNAIKYLKLAISLGDHSAKTYTYLGYAYYHIGDYVKAIQTFNKAIEIDDNYPESYEGIGLAYLKLKSPFAAQTALKKAFKLNPDEISYGINLAVAFISSGDFKESLSVLDKLEDRYPLVPEVHYNKAIVLLKQNKVKEAIRELKIFVELAKSPYYRDYTDKVRQVIGMFERRENEH
jgi:tetratricopeptide (TPR) repeat protein